MNRGVYLSCRVHTHTVSMFDCNIGVVIWDVEVAQGNNTLFIAASGGCLEG